MSDNQTIINYKRAQVEHRKVIAIRLPIPVWSEAHLWGDYHFALSLRKALERIGYKAYILIDNESVLTKTDVILDIRGKKRKGATPDGILKLMWNISHPKEVAEAEYEWYDHVFVASLFYAKELAKRIKTPVTELLQCTDPEIFYPRKVKKEYPYLFVGNSRGELRTSVDYAIKAGIDLAVVGQDWEELIPEKYIIGTHVENELLGELYSKAEVVLNDHWPDMAELGFVSNRVFDVLACGSTILTDDVNGLRNSAFENIFIYNGYDSFSSQLSKMKKHQLVIGNDFPQSFDSRTETMQKIITQLFKN